MGKVVLYTLKQGNFYTHLMNIVNFCKYEKISNLRILDIFKVKFLKKTSFYFWLFFINQSIAYEVSAHIKSAWTDCSINSIGNLKIDHFQSL